MVATSDAAEVLLAVADHLFSVSIHFQASGLDDEMSTVLRAALDLALRGQLMKATGKRKCVCESTKVLHILRTIGVTDKKATKAAFKMMVHGLDASVPERRRLLATFYRGPYPDPSAPGLPRAEDEAKRIYNGTTLPMPACRSVVNPRRQTSNG